ncbi:hypothetical protein LTR37_021537, partial [Vermiconidia calcicola]
MHRRDKDVKQAFEDSVLGISLPQTSSYVRNGAYLAANPRYRLPSEFNPPTPPVMRDVTPPVPSYAQSATPSTRYTDSPFSHVPTPSSASSYSPAVVATSKASPFAGQSSPTRSSPPGANQPSDKLGPNRSGLPSVRESSTSSSNSTVRPFTSTTAVPRKGIPRKSATAPPTSKDFEIDRPSSRAIQTKENLRQPTASSRTKSPLQVPPELAHLNVDPPPRLNKALPPRRPSRDGTPTLTGLNAPSPVVQSDLPRLYTTYHKRTPSQETNNPTSPVVSRFGFSPKGSSKHPSPRIDSAVSPPPAARIFAREPTPEAASSGRPKLARRDSPAVGPAPSPSKSPHFGFFSRKPRSDSPQPFEKPKRQPTKGPVAGTGHERYGRFGIRGRSGSTTSSTDFRSPGTDSSTSSLPRRPSQRRKSSITSKDGSDLDDFLRERLTPVVLRGSGSTVSNTASSSDVPASNAPTSNTSSFEGHRKPHLLPSSMSNYAGMRSLRRPKNDPHAPSDSGEDDTPAHHSALAARRSLTRLSQSDGMSHARVPSPIDTSRPAKGPSFDSYDSKGLPWPRTDESVPSEKPSEGREGLFLRPQQIDNGAKPSRKWNFFQRAQASPRIKGKDKATAPHGAPPSANTTVTQSPYRGAAHYAMLDPVEPVGLEEITRIMQENDASAEESMSDSNAHPKMVPYERRHRGLLPPPPNQEHSKDSDFKVRPNLPTITVRQGSSAPPPDPDTLFGPSLHRQTQQARNNVCTPEMLHGTLNTPETQFEDSPPRQPRLSPVGRIPQVVSKRDRDRKLSDSSFSRPFARAQPRPTVKPPGSLYNQIRELASPIESGSQPVSSTSTRSDNISNEQKSSVNTNASSVSTNRTSMDIHGNNEFFSFPPRKNSDLSYSSSSGYNSWTATVIPQPPQEEDVWTEYNDLLDHVMPERTPLSATSSLGAPFQYSSMLDETNGQTRLAARNSREAPSSRLPALPHSRAEPSVLSVPQQITRFMQPSMSPLTTPNQLAEFLDHYGNRST